MTTKLNSYIDNSIIREYASRDIDGISLDVTDLNSYEKDNLIDRMLQFDDVTREIILDRMQELIDQRIPFVESKNNYDRGLRPIHDSQTGEVRWLPR